MPALQADRRRSDSVGGIARDERAELRRDGCAPVRTRELRTLV